MVAMLVFATTFAAAQTQRTDWDGVFTDAQAARGRTAYLQRCASCHGEDLDGDGNGIAPPLHGPQFLGNWDGLSLAQLLERVRLDSAPAAGSQALGFQQQVDVLAYLLSANGKPAGESELPASQADAAQIRFLALRPAR